MKARRRFTIGSFDISPAFIATALFLRRTRFHNSAKRCRASQTAAARFHMPSTRNAEKNIEAHAIARVDHANSRGCRCTSSSCITSIAQARLSLTCPGMALTPRARMSAGARTAPCHRAVPPCSTAAAVARSFRSARSGRISTRCGSTRWCASIRCRERPATPCA